MSPFEKSVEELHQSRWAEIGFDRLHPFEKNHVGIFWLVGEVMNGGMHQFFFNSSGDLLQYAVASLREIGAVKTLALVEEAVALIPCGYCEDREERIRRLRQIPNEIEAFDSVSDRLQDYPEPVESMSLQLIAERYRALGLLTP